MGLEERDVPPAARGGHDLADPRDINRGPVPSTHRA
jgi:hypothetical protein